MEAAPVGQFNSHCTFHRSSPWVVAQDSAWTVTELCSSTRNPLAGLREGSGASSQHQGISHSTKPESLSQGRKCQHQGIPSPIPNKNTTATTELPACDFNSSVAKTGTGTRAFPKPCQQGKAGLFTEMKEKKVAQKQRKDERKVGLK